MMNDDYRMINNYTNNFIEVRVNMKCE